MARKNPIVNHTDRIALNQNVVNPVGNAENTGKGKRERKAPSLVTSGSKALNQKVVNPVARKAKSLSDQGNV